MITVNLELSKKLKEAGYPQKGNFEWTYVPNDLYSENPTGSSQMIMPAIGGVTGIASPTADEILDFLPAQIKNKRLQIDKMPAGEFCISYIPFNASDQEEIVVFGTTPTLADTLAKMWLYLKENNLLEVKG